MSTEPSTPRWALPYESPAPSDPVARKRARALRIVTYVLLAAALIVPAVQFQVKTMSNYRKAGEAGLSSPGAGVKTTKGAIGRWRKAVRAFWAGQSIYGPYPADKTPTRPSALGRDVWMHPNMPIVVILLTPFAYMPVWLMAVSYNVLKIGVLIAAGLMAIRVVNHARQRMPDWVVALALVWGMMLVVDDVLHGNTNSFVLGAIVGHLWLFRRGRDVLAGAPLALAICLKLTPGLFLLYWLYQRNWKVLASTVAFLAAVAVAIPAAAVGPTRYKALTGEWFDNVIRPPLKGAWYPAHINQSISGVFSRYLLDGQPDGDIYSNPDDLPYQFLDEHGWIGVASLSPGTVRVLVRVAGLAVLGLIAWAIGWRRLPRDDGRRALHYSLVLLGMMLMNQRTWEQHAAPLLLAALAAWYAIAFSTVSRRVRAVALGLMLAGGVLIWATSQGAFKVLAVLMGRDKDLGEHWANLAEAYGMTFFYFLLLLAVLVIFSVALRTSQRPYSTQRQKLSA